MKLLEIKNLRTVFNTGRKTFAAVDDISFDVEPGKTVAVIGESGSGKSVTALSIMGLIDYPGKITGGQILFKGENLLEKKEKQLMNIRGNEIAMIYQDPMVCLNPYIPVGDQIAEAIIIHKKADKAGAVKKALELMKLVSIGDEEERYKQLPEKFSGGMRQRIMIAMAVACNPEILIADEPTTALDVTIQAEILELLNELKVKNNMAILLNSHDLEVVSVMADEVVVLYCGKVMEIASREEILNNPRNMYTKMLISCLPKMGDKRDRLETIPGYVPDIARLPEGCRFSNRCSKANERCRKEMPQLIEVQKGHWSRCWINEEE